MTRVRESLRAFLSGLIDYAGLFPPASLDLETAIHNHARYVRDADAWVLSRFIAPTARFTQLAPHAALFADGPQLSLSALVAQSDDAQACVAAVRDSVHQVEWLRDRCPETVRVEALEVPLPPERVTRDVFARIAELAAEARLEVACEVTAPRDEHWRTLLFDTLDAMAAHVATGATPVQFKLRTGGVTAAAIPTCGQVAAAIAGCQQRGLAMKFTAGLHHPLRMEREEVGARMHGFVNVFAAGLLAFAHKWDEPQLQALVADEDAAHFGFTADGLQYGNAFVSTEDIRRLRQSHLRSYGSCSFTEPLEDLRALGDLER